MTPLAITFMIIAMLVIWGGLVISLVFLGRHPLPPDADADTGAGVDQVPDAGEPGTGRRRRAGDRSGPGGTPGPGHVPGQWPPRE